MSGTPGLTAIQHICALVWLAGRTCCGVFRKKNTRGSLMWRAVTSPFILLSSTFSPRPYLPVLFCWSNHRPLFRSLCLSHCLHTAKCFSLIVSPPHPKCFCRVVLRSDCWDDNAVTVCVRVCRYWTNSCDMAAAKKSEFSLLLSLTVSNYCHVHKHFTFELLPGFSVAQSVFLQLWEAVESILSCSQRVDSN